MFPLKFYAGSKNIIIFFKQLQDKNIIIFLIAVTGESPFKNIIIFYKSKKFKKPVDII